MHRQPIKYLGASLTRNCSGGAVNLERYSEHACRQTPGVSGFCLRRRTRLTPAEFFLESCGFLHPARSGQPRGVKRRSEIAKAEGLRRVSVTRSRPRPGRPRVGAAMALTTMVGRRSRAAKASNALSSGCVPGQRLPRPHQTVAGLGQPSPSRPDGRGARRELRVAAITAPANLSPLRPCPAGSRRIAARPSAPQWS